MVRLSWDELLPEEEGTEQAVAPAPPAPASQMRRGPAPSPDPAPAEDAEKPKWKRLERKYLLLRPEQITELDTLARQIQRRKREAGRAGEGERVTANTLVRAMVTVGLEHGEALQGADEEEVLASLRAALAAVAEA